MKKYIATLKVFEADEAFYDTIAFMDDKEKAKRTFAELIEIKDEGDRWDFMAEFMSKHHEFYIVIPDIMRKFYELDDGLYYVLRDSYDGLSIDIE